MRPTPVLLTLLTCLLPAPPVLAQGAVPGPVVDADWLAGELESPDLVVVHVGGDEESYREGHLPGARWLDLSRLVFSRGEPGDADFARFEVPEEVETVRTALEEAGISDDSRVVVAVSEPRRVTTATRVLWTLEYMGLGDRSAILDGGLPAWTEAGYALESGAVAVEPGELTTGPSERLRVSRGWVRDNLDTPGVALVDGRGWEAYTGEREEIPGRAGHIPGAGSLPIEELFGEDGRVKDRDTVRELLRSAGVAEGDTVVAYCHIGLRATSVILAARLAGFDAVLYDGSMIDWALDRDLPLVRSPERR